MRSQRVSERVYARLRVPALMSDTPAAARGSVTVALCEPVSALPCSPLLRWRRAQPRQASRAPDPFARARRGEDHSPERGLLRTDLRLVGDHARRRSRPQRLRCPRQWSRPAHRRHVRARAGRHPDLLRVARSRHVRVGDEGGLHPRGGPRNVGQPRRARRKIDERRRELRADLVGLVVGEEVQDIGARSTRCSCR